MFYICLGDTVFDTLFGSQQINNGVTLVFLLGWIFIGQNLIVNITLAMVEKGFIDQKFNNRRRAMFEPSSDPYYRSQKDIEEQTYITPPDILKNHNKSHSAESLRLMPISGSQTLMIESLYEKSFTRLEDVLQTTEYLEQFSKIRSNKQLMLILSIDEINKLDKEWEDTKQLEGRSISSKIRLLIDYKSTLF